MAVFDRLKDKQSVRAQAAPLMQTSVQQPQEQKNPYQVLETPRSSELADRIKSILGAADKQQKSADKSIRSYESALKRSPAKSFADQESNYLSRFFDSRAQQDLEGMRTRQADALRRAADIARGNVRRDLKSAGFASNAGSGSRLDRMALDRNMAIEADIANRMAASERGDYDYLNRMRGAAVGQRGSIYDRLAGRELLPMQARQQQLNTQLGLLGNMKINHYHKRLTILILLPINKYHFYLNHMF